MRPNFLVIGSQKAGTSTLWAVLRRHPQVFMCPTKEPNFFFLESEWRRGLGYYEGLFAGAPEGALRVGEASPGYVCHPDVPDRVAAHLPDAKLVLTVRNPIDRAYSQYWDARRQLRIPLDFGDAVAEGLEEAYVPGRIGYFSRGVYIRYIEAWLERFPREQLHVIVLDDLKADPQGEYRRLFQFLEVDPDFTCPEMEARANASTVFRNPAYRVFLDHPRWTRRLPLGSRRLLLTGPEEPYRYPPMAPGVRARLVDFYRPHNAALSEFLDRPLDWDR